MVEVALSEIPSDALNALREIIEKELNSKQYNLKITSASTLGETNFIGVIYRATFNKEGESDQKLILKVAPQNEIRRTQFFARTAFLREIYIYDTVLPCFREFEQSKGVVINHAFTEYPKCYHTVDGELQESLVLEDLCVHNFRLINKPTEKPNVDHINLILIALAKLHAISFAMEDQQPEKFKKLISKLDETYLRSGLLSIREFFKNQTKDVVKVVSDEKDAHLLAKVNKLLEKEPFDIAIEGVSAEFGGVITHADVSINNALFKYDSNGKPIELRLLDWQITRYASPATDLAYLMFCSTTKELRDIHYDNFLKFYHENLSAQIRRLGSDPEKLFPYSKLLDHLHQFSRYALMLATQLIPILTKDSSNTLDLNEASSRMDNLECGIFSGIVSESSIKEYHKRLRDVIVDMVRLEYI